MKRWAFLLLMGMAHCAYAVSVDAIFNKALQTREISRTDARNLYLLKERSINGAKVHVFRLPLGDPLHAEFVRDVLAYDPVAFDAEWAKLVNTGLAPQIEEVASPYDMLMTISRNRGGIGYLSHSFMVLNQGGRNAVIVRIK